MRATTAIILILLLLAVVFIVTNLAPASVSFFGLTQITQPLGVIVSVAFLAGALLVYFLKTGIELQQTWRDRQHKKTSKALLTAAQEYQEALEAHVKGNLGAAKEAFKKVVRQNPDHVGALLALGNLERESGEVESAIQRHITANARKPGSVDILRALSEDYASASRVDECIRALDDILALAPKDQHALRKKRDVYEAAGRFDEAITAHQSLLKAGSADEGRLTVLRLKASQETTSPEKARAYLEAAIQKNKKCAAAYRLLGELFWKQNNDREAAKTWKGGWKATGDPALLQRLCEAHLASGEGKKALKLCRQAKEGKPHEALPALLYAATALKLDDLSEAKGALSSQALSDHPEVNLFRLELSRRSSEPDALEEKTKEAFAAFQSSTTPFKCNACGETLEEWSPQCISCDSWDSVRLASVGRFVFPEPEEVEVPSDLDVEKEHPS
jgi:lipopolysaccharide biosynthesis regulator YciM